MKIRYNNEFDCYETIECNKTGIIELDGVQLIPVSVLTRLQLNKIQREIVANIISELKGE